MTMENFNISVEAIIQEIMAENRKLVLEAATLRAAISEITRQSDELSEVVNGGNLQPAITEVSE